jgi:hypothetical protein
MIGRTCVVSCYDLDATLRDLGSLRAYPLIRNMPLDYCLKRLYFIHF